MDTVGNWSSLVAAIMGTLSVVVFVWDARRRQRPVLGAWTSSYASEVNGVRAVMVSYVAPGAAAQVTILEGDRPLLSQPHCGPGEMLGPIEITGERLVVEWTPAPIDRGWRALDIIEVPPPGTTAPSGSAERLRPLLLTPRQQRQLRPAPGAPASWWQRPAERQTLRKLHRWRTSAGLETTSAAPTTDGAEG